MINKTEVPEAVPNLSSIVAVPPQPRTTSLLQQADELLVQEHFAQAEQCYRDLIHGLEELLGSDHREVATALHKLAAVLAAQNKLEEAAVLESRANIIIAAHES